VNGDEFIRRARKWARQRDVAFREDASRGKGGHRMVYVGDHLTTVKSGEIGKGLLHAMLKQLAVPPDEF